MRILKRLIFALCFLPVILIDITVCLLLWLWKGEAELFYITDSVYDWTKR